MVNLFENTQVTPNYVRRPSPAFCRFQNIGKFAGKRTAKNLAGQTDPKIQQHRDTLTRLKKDFLAHATITTQRGVGKLLDSGA